MRTIALDEDRDLVELLPDDDGLLWLRGDSGFCAWGEALRVDAGVGEGRFARAAGAFAELVAGLAVDDEVGGPGTGPVAFGSFTFDPQTSGSLLVVPAVTVGRRDGRTWLTASGDLPSLPLPSVPLRPAADRARYAGASIPDLLWLDAVATAIGEIRAGDLDKVVLARDHAVWSREPFDGRWLAHRLSRRFPDCHTFLVARLIGASPELLVRRTGRLVESLVLAGSAARGGATNDDQRLGEGLLASKKDRCEHELAVGSVVEVLAPRCETLDVDPEPRLLRLENVQHLATRVRGTLAGDDTALDLAGLLHPTAAVGGVPRDVALERIRALEGMDRGRYAGPVGWVDARGDGEWAIALRCAELSGARARLFAGAGIVADSLPEAELEETRLKLLAVQSALDPPDPPDARVV